MRNRPGIIAIIVIVAAAVSIIGLVAMPILIVGDNLGGSLAKASGVGGYGCFVADQYFGDTTAASNKENIITKLGQKYPEAKKNANYIREVLEKGEKEGINPLIPLAIWAGEQGFSNPEKAFGYGYTDSGIRGGVTNWNAQLNGVYGRIKDTVNVTGYYAKPAGTNNFTRLFYNYTTAMRYVYENSGNSWDEEGRYKDGSKPVKARLAVFRLVANHQITCQTTTLIASARGGNDGVPLYKQNDYPQSYGSSTIAKSGCCTVSAAMVMNYYGLNVDPVIISNLSASNGYYVPGSGTNHAGFYPFLAQKYQMKFTNLGEDWNRAINLLEANKPLIVRGEGASPFTSTGHCIVVTGYDKNTQMFRVNNPAGGDGPYSLAHMKRYATVIYEISK